MKVYSENNWDFSVMVLVCWYYFWLLVKQRNWKGCVLLWLWIGTRTIMYGRKFWQCSICLWICVYECKGIIMWEWALLGLMELFGVWFWWDGNLLKKKKKSVLLCLFVKKLQEQQRKEMKRKFNFFSLKFEKLIFFLFLKF